MQGQACHKPAKTKLDKYRPGGTYVWSESPTGNPLHHIGQTSIHLWWARYSRLVQRFFLASPEPGSFNI